VSDLEHAGLKLAALYELPASTRRDITRAEMVLRAAARRHWALQRKTEDVETAE